MNETLICTVCGGKWQRLRVRGRKPAVCPQCIAEEISDFEIRDDNINLALRTSATDSQKNIVSNVYNSYYPKDAAVCEITKSKPKTKWFCIYCGFEMVTLIPLTAVPLHKCAQNTSTLVELSLSR